MITIYGYPSTRSTRAVWALEEAGVEYNFIRVDLAKGEQKQPAFLKVHPSGKVPVLVDGDLVLSESSAICIYIGDKFPQSGLVPPVSDPVNRAYYLQWCFFAMTELEVPLLMLGSYKKILSEGEQLSAAAEKCKADFDHSAATLAQHMENREYAVGQQLTVADIILARVLNWARGQSMVLPAVLNAYTDRMIARPALARANARESAT